MRAVLKQFGNSMETELAKEIAASVQEKEMPSIELTHTRTIGIPPSIGYYPSQDGQELNYDTYRKPSEKLTERSKSKLISIRSLLIDSFLALSVLGLVIYFQVTWLVYLSPVLICIFVLTRHYRWLQRFLNGFF